MYGNIPIFSANIHDKPLKTASTYCLIICNTTICLFLMTAGKKIPPPAEKRESSPFPTFTQPRYSFSVCSNRSVSPPACHSPRSRLHLLELRAHLKHIYIGEFPGMNFKHSLQIFKCLRLFGRPFQKLNFDLFYEIRKKKVLILISFGISLLLEQLQCKK